MFLYPRQQENLFIMLQVGSTVIDPDWIMEKIFPLLTKEKVNWYLPATSTKARAVCILRVILRSRLKQRNVARRGRSYQWWQYRYLESKRRGKRPPVKIGKGTLLVQAKGENQGSVSVGDGKVILDQQADDQGKKQAFSEIGLVSGRGRCNWMPIISSTPTNSISAFAADVWIWTGIRFRSTAFKIPMKGRWLSTTIKTKNPPLPLQAIKILLQPAITTTWIAKEIAYNGWFGEKDATKTNGRLNLNYQPEEADRTLLLSGGTNLNGNITQTNGKLFFSGRPTPHAYNHLGSGWSKWKVSHKEKSCGTTIDRPHI